MTPILAVIDPWILAFSAVTVFVTIFMGFWSAKKSKTASDFFVAGRSVSVGWNASAISGEYLSAASFMGIAGMVMSSGYDALWYPVCYACGYLFLLLFIAGPLRRFGAYTIPDFAEGRYDSPLFRKIAVVFVLFIGFFYTMPQMKGAGVTLAYIFPGLPYWVGVVLVGAVITLNVALGGMKGITLVQAFQYWAKMFAISVPIFVLMAAYGHYGKQVGVNGGNTTQPAFLFQQLLATNFYKFATNTDYPNISAAWNAERTLDQKVKSAFNEATGREIVTGMKTMTVRQAIGGYNAVVHQDIYVAKNLANDQESHSYPGFQLTRTRAQHIQDLEEFLRTNNVAIVHVASGEILAVPVQEAARYSNSSGGPRLSLPEKAPADSTWLSPFGPLTTKAAKAAAAGKSEPDWSKRSQLSDPLPFVQTKPNLLRDLDQFTEKFDSERPSGNFQWTTNEPLWAILTRLKSAAGLSDILCETNLLLKTIVINQPRELRATESVSFVETTLKEQGVSIIRASKQEWWAVPASQATSYIRPLETKPYALLYTYSLIIALVCGTAGLPHILVRFYTNPDGVAAKRTTMWVMILIGIFYVFPPVFGVLGRNLMPELYNGLTGVKGTDGIVLKLPTILSERFGVLGSILSGVTCAGAFAAFMSTFSGLLVSMTGALAHDVYGRMLRPKSTPENRLRAFKFCAVLIGGIAIVLGCFVEPLEINFMVGQAFAIAAASYFPLLFMSVWWRGMTMKGAAIGMLAGGLCALFAVALTNFSNLALDKGPMGKIFAGFAPMNDFWAAHPLLRILCEQPAIWTVPLAIGLMIIVSKLTSRAVPSDVRMKMLVLHAPEKLGLKQEYIQEHQHGH